METLHFRIWDRENRAMIYSEDAWVTFVFHEHSTYPEAHLFDRNRQVWKWLPLSDAFRANTSLRQHAVPCPELLPEPGSTMPVLSSGTYNQDWPSKDQFAARQQPLRSAIAEDVRKMSWN